MTTSQTTQSLQAFIFIEIEAVEKPPKSDDKASGCQMRSRWNLGAVSKKDNVPSFCIDRAPFFAHGVQHPHGFFRTDLDSESRWSPEIEVRGAQLIGVNELRTGKADGVLGEKPTVQTEVDVLPIQVLIKFRNDVSAEIIHVLVCALPTVFWTRRPRASCFGPAFSSG